MTHLAAGDDDLHRDDGTHYLTPPATVTDTAGWGRRMLAHRAEHRTRSGNTSIWERGRHRSGGLRTDQAEPGA